MIIDFHTHMFPDKIAESTIRFLAETCKTPPHTNGTYEGLLSSTQEAGITLSVALPVVTKPSQFRSVNEFASHYRNENILSFGGLHPACSDHRSELRELKEMGFLGIKLHPDYQDMYFNDIRYKRILDYASELGLIVVVHAGVDPKCPNNVHCTPRMIEEVLNEVAPEKLVLAHFGANKMWDEVEELLIGRNVYLDTAVVLDTMPEEQFVRMVHAHGADKILFATDSPWRGQKEFVTRMNEIGLTEEERAQIFSGTACKLLNIE